MQIKGTHTLVTGAASGIGRATAYALAEAGAASVAIADLDEAGLKTSAAAIEQRGAKALVHPVDVTDAAQQRAMFDAVVKAFGGLDVVHNNAGIICGGDSWPDTNLDRISAVVSVNLIGVIYGTRLAVETLSGLGGGVIVNTASTASLGPMPVDPTYSATKTGVVNLTQSCAGLAESHGIRVNAVLPGITETAIINHTGDGKKPADWMLPALEQVTMLSPDHIAEGVLELVNDDTRAGECLVVDNPPSSDAPPAKTRLRTPTEFHAFVAKRLAKL